MQSSRKCSNKVTHNSITRQPVADEQCLVQIAVFALREQVLGAARIDRTTSQNWPHEVECCQCDDTGRVTQILVDNEALEARRIVVVDKRECRNAANSVED